MLAQTPPLVSGPPNWGPQTREQIGTMDPDSDTHFPNRTCRPDPTPKARQTRNTQSHLLLGMPPAPSQARSLIYDSHGIANQWGERDSSVHNWITIRKNTDPHLRVVLQMH